jgi:hypothetical protein
MDYLQNVKAILTTFLSKARKVLDRIASAERLSVSYRGD